MTWFYLALITAVIFGIIAILEKDASHGEHAIQFTASSALLTAVLALALIPLVHLDLPLKTWALMLAAGSIGGTSYYLGAKGFKYLSLSEASPLYNIGTVITIVLAVLLLGEKMTFSQGVGVSLIILGTYVLELKRNNIFSPFIKVFRSEKIHYVLIATILSSVLIVFSKYILGYVEPITYMFVYLMVNSGFLLLLVFTRHEGWKDLKKGFTVHRWAVIGIAGLTLLASLTDIFAISLGEAALYAPVMRMWTLIAVLFGGAFLKEGHIRNRLIATIIMLAGVFIIYL